MCFYQPDSDPVKKCAWVEKLETILAAVHSKWDGILVIAGDITLILQFHHLLLKNIRQYCAHLILTSTLRILPIKANG